MGQVKMLADQAITQRELSRLLKGTKVGAARLFVRLDIGNYTLIVDGQ
jgi:hypothetical protein